MPDGYAIPSTLRTPRLLLRPIVTDDAECVFAYASDSLVTRYVTWPTHRSIDDSLDFVRQAARRSESGIASMWAIHHTADNRMIGTLGLDAINDKNFSGSIGYVLARQYWGQGIMTEVLRTILDTLFRTTPLNRIEACCLTANLASARVMEKCGMTFEGVRREGHYFKDRFHDTRHYAILRGDWLAFRAR